MNTQNTGFSGTRLLIVLGFGLVIMAAGQGCQMSGGHCGPMGGGMMDGGMMGSMHGNASDASEAETVDDPSLDDETTQWLQGAHGFDGVADRTGQDVVVVEVGAGDGLEYGSPAVRVDPGTTIRWRWTGKGGRHDVAFATADISSSLKGEAGATFTHTFDTSGTYRYECTPHAGIGMRGAVIVASK